MKVSSRMAALAVRSVSSILDVSIFFEPVKSTIFTRCRSSML